MFFKFILTFFLAVSFYFSHSQLPDSVNANDLEYLRFGLRYDRFSNDLSDWVTGTVSYRFQRNTFQFIPSLTLSERFDRTGLLAEIDVYKKFANKDYLNIAGGVSTSSIFPTRRATIEYFNPFGKWEHSVGVTYTHFTNFGDLFTVIASLSKYHGNWLSTLRLYVAFQPDEQLNNLSFYNENRYYVSDNSYFSFSLRYGFDTNFISVIDNSDALITAPSVLYGVGLGYNSVIKNYMQWKLTAEWSRYDFEVFDRYQYSLSLYLTRFQK